MSMTDIGPWKLFEQRSNTAFLVAGILLFGYAVLRGIEMVMETTFHTAFMTGYGLVAVFPLVVGLLGLYLQLNDHKPRLALAGMTASLVAGLLMVVLIGWLLGTTLMMEGYPSIPEDAPAWTGAATLVVFLALIVGFLLFSVASLRTTRISRTVGLLLLAPSVLWIGFIVGSVVAPAGHAITVLVYTPMSVALVTIWYLRRTDPEQIDRAEPAPDSATR